jgi:hypothetical protein
VVELFHVARRFRPEVGEARVAHQRLERCEVRGLAELRHQPRQHAGGERGQSWAAGAGDEREQAPPQPIGAGLGIALDQTAVGKCRQRARHLTLFIPDELRDLDHAEAVAGGRAVGAECEQNSTPRFRLGDRWTTIVVSVASMSVDRNNAVRSADQRCERGESA